jgi:C4-dicarboxylate-specific signal transduction histidine kinase
VGHFDPGIDAKHLDRVFDAFYTTKSSCIGIGQSIYQSIIHAGGRRRVSANVPRGAIFQFTSASGETNSRILSVHQKSDK